MTPTQIKDTRQSLGLTAKQMAVALGYSAASRIYEIESGTRTPGKAVVMLLQAYMAGYRPIDWPQGRSDLSKRT